MSADELLITFVLALFPGRILAAFARYFVITSGNFLLDSFSAKMVGKHNGMWSVSK